MTVFGIPHHGLLQAALLLACVMFCVKPVGLYIARAMSGHPTLLFPLLAPIETFLYRACGIDPAQEQDWKTYARALLLFSFVAFTGSFLLFVGQHFPHISLDLAFNAAASFVTNTDWQAYTPETTFTVQSQMLGLTVQNFLSAAVGLCALMAFIRGLGRSKSTAIGNFWVDLVRGALYVLLPFSLLFAVILVSQGVVQSFGATIPVSTLEGNANQLLATGPVASLVAIKEIGTNGGAYYAAGAAHPFENPTPLTNFLQMFMVLLLPASLAITFGHLVNDKRQGYALLAVKILIIVPLILLPLSMETAGNPLLDNPQINQTAGNMEGKELRLGASGSAIWLTTNAGATSGSSNAAIDSFMPLSILSPLSLIQTGQAIFGGVGSGLYSLLLYMILTVFVAGLMTGRRPEYLGKNISTSEIKWASLAILFPSVLALLATGAAVMWDHGKLAASNPHAHGLLQIIYTFATTANNNGSAMAGASVQTPFYHLILGLLMLLCRYAVLLCVLGIAGTLAEKQINRTGRQTLNTSSPLFIAFVIAIIALFAVPSLAPTVALGPVASHLNLIAMQRVSL